MSTPTLSIAREILRTYDERFLEVDPPVRRRMTVATKGLLDGLLAGDARRDLPEGLRLRAFCISNDLFDELERLIADELAGRREGAVVVGGRVYAVYPYLRGVPRQDADITAEVGLDHRLDALTWERGRLKVRGRAAIDRVQARDPLVELVLTGPGPERRVPATAAGAAFEAFIDLPDDGHWTVTLSVQALGLTRTAPFGTHRDAGFKPPKPREGLVVTAEGPLELTVSAAVTEEPRARRRFWEFRRARQA